MVSYAKRASLFEKGEQTWTVTPDALQWSPPGGAARSLPWREITEIRLGFEPTRFKWDRYRLSLTAAGRHWSVDNQHFAGIADFENRSATFVPFVLACVERVAALSPGAKARLGSSAASYWAQLIFVATMFALLVTVLILLPTRHSAVFWIKATVIALSLPLLVQWIRKARPRRTTLDVEAFRAALPGG